MTQLTSPPVTFHAALGSRELFPELQAQVYANHAAISPPSLAVRSEIIRAVTDFERNGVDAFAPWLEQRKATKRALATLIGAAPEDIALVPNTTAGINAVALCFPWVSGDRVAVFRGEFPTNVTPWQTAAQSFDLEIIFLDLGPFAQECGPDLGPLEDALKDGLRMVALSAVQFQTGLRIPTSEIAELCHRYGAQLCVDGIQAVGVIPLDLRGIDYLAVGGHKWLMGPEGAGMLYVAPGRSAALKKNLAGWLSHHEPLKFLFEGPNLLRYDRPVRDSIDFLEGGALNTIGYAGLGAAVELLNQLGVEQIFRHVQTWHDALEPGLSARGFVSQRAPDIARRSGTLSVLPPSHIDVLRIHTHLQECGVSCTTPDGYLRFAPHWPNAIHETRIVLDAIDTYTETC